MRHCACGGYCQERYSQSEMINNSNTECLHAAEQEVIFIPHEVLFSFSILEV